MFGRRSTPDSMNSIWAEIHDAEHRIGRLENEALEAHAHAEGERDAVQKRFSRRQKIIVGISTGVAMISAIVTILTKIPGLL